MGWVEVTEHDSLFATIFIFILQNFFYFKIKKKRL